MQPLQLAFIHYGYFIILPFAIVEGPILTIIAGFMVTLNIFNPFIVYGIVILGDIIGDSLLYWAGRSGSRFFFRFIGPRLGVSETKMDGAKEYFAARTTRNLIMAKVIHGIGMSGLVAAGSLKIPYRQFVTTCLLTSMVQSGLLLVVGMLFGHAYQQLGQYLDYFAGGMAVIALGVIVFFLFKKYRIKTRL